MQNILTSIKQQRLELDQKLLADLKNLGVITTQSDLSRLCGKNPTYYACMRAREYGLQLGSLIFLAARLAKRIDETSCVRERAQLRAALNHINQVITAKCRLREQELGLDG